MSIFSTKAPAGRDTPPRPAGTHAVLNVPIQGPWDEGAEVLYVAAGCFWGVERMFWSLPGVLNTAVGYIGGQTPNPTYRDVCTGRSGHAEGVQIVYDPTQVTPEELLKVFWENHDPTTRNRQGNDIGTQYRSAIYWTTPEQADAAQTTHDTFAKVLIEHGRGAISTEMTPAENAGTFYYAEPEHQQYLHKNPGGYCNHGPTGCTLPIH